MAPAGNQPADDAHVRFVRTALAFGILGGFMLAVFLPAQAAVGRMNLSWLTHAQVHGHLQVIGFAGLFVVGMSLRLSPRFGIGRLAYPQVVSPMFWAISGGLLLRTFGQPVADRPALAALMTLGAGLELAGAALLAVLTLSTMRPALAAGAPHAVLLGAGALWMLAQSLVGVFTIWELAESGGLLLGFERNRALVNMQIYGFLLCSFAGVGLRVFPAFFGMPTPSRRFGLAAAALLNAGLAVWVLAPSPRGVGAGQLIVGIGILVLVTAFGWWRRETRFAIASAPLSWTLRGALVSLSLTGVFLAVTAGLAAYHGRGVSVAHADAVRHLFGLGVVTLGIVGMSQLILPEFATERLTRKPGRWHGAYFTIPLLLAAALRGLSAAFDLSPQVRYWTMEIAGLIALATVIAFARLYTRARRAHAAHLARIASRSDPELRIAPGG